MKTFAPLLLCLGLLAGCYSATGTRSADPVSYFMITNAKAGLVAVVDDNPAVTLDPVKGAARLKVSPGKHRIRIQSAGTTVVDRTVLVSDLQTLEISVP